MNIYEKLLAIQQELKVKKDQNNDFGGFKYRSAEKIFEEVKPICQKQNAVLRATDEVVEVAGKPYVKAVAELIDTEIQGEVYSIAAVGYARIPDQRKGMDDCQITGSASSYARKYAMCGLFCIDDNKDSDVPPALPDKREDFEAYANKYYGKKDKEKAMEENQKKLDEAENWRYISADNIEVKMTGGRQAGKWINLDNCPLNWLEVLIQKEEFDGIKADIQKRIDLIKGAK